METEYILAIEDGQQPWQQTSEPEAREPRIEVSSSTVVKLAEGKASNNLADGSGPKENTVIAMTTGLYLDEEGGPQVQDGDYHSGHSQHFVDQRGMSSEGDVTLGFITNKDCATGSDCVSWTKITLMPSGLSVCQEHRSQLLTQQTLPTVNIVERGTQTEDSRGNLIRRDSPHTPPKCSVNVTTDTCARNETWIQHQVALFGRMWELQQVGTLCDLTLEADDGSVRVHSLILAASSPALLAICCQHTGSLGHVRLPGVCLDDCTQVVQYLYTGRLSVNHTRTKTFLDLCKKWDLKAAIEFSGPPPFERLSLERVGPEGKLTFSVEQHDKHNVNQEPGEDGDKADCHGHDPSTELVEDGDQSDCDGQGPAPLEPAEDGNQCDRDGWGPHLPKQNEVGDQCGGDGPDGNPHCTLSASLKSSVSDRLRPRAAATNCRTRSVTQRLLRQSPRKIKAGNDDYFDHGPRKNTEKTTHNTTLGKSSSEGDIPVARKRGRPRKCPPPTESDNLEIEKKKCMERKFSVTRKAKTNEASDSSLEMENIQELDKPGVGIAADIWACTKCNENFETKGELQEHNRKHRHLKCHRCHVKFETLEQLEKHRQQEHQGRGKNHMYTCDKCGKTFKERNNLVVHQYKNHWTEGMEEPKFFVCQVEGCKFKTTRRGSMYVHKFKHSDERSVMCDLCGACFKNRICLKQHTNGMHSKEKVEYSCNKCDATFKRQLGLTIHEKRVHQNVGPQFMCNHCPHMAFSKINLHTHMFYKHNIPIPGVQIHICPECGYKSHSLTLLNRHIARHSADRRFICDICKKTYCTEVDLKSHKARHDASKKLQCKYCDYSSAYGPKRMKEHISKQHEQKGLKPWMCHVCKYRTNEKGNLTKHIRNVHKLDVQNQRHTLRKAVPGDDINKMMVSSPRFQITPLPQGEVQPIDRSHQETNFTSVCDSINLHQLDVCSLDGPHSQHESSLVEQPTSNDTQLHRLRANQPDHLQCHEKIQHLSQQEQLQSIFQPQVISTVNSPPCLQSAPVLSTMLPPGGMLTEPTYQSLLGGVGMNIARTAVDYSLTSPYLSTDTSPFSGYPK